MGRRQQTDASPKRKGPWEQNHWNKRRVKLNYKRQRNLDLYRKKKMLRPPKEMTNQTRRKHLVDILIRNL
ncbi:unnamed protein product [Arctogadus glacialis]